MVDPGGVKHLEMVQAVITRLANNAFLIKGWSITVVTAILGFAIKEGPAALALAGLVPAAMFWLLDAYYLTLERDFRKLYGSTVTHLTGGGAPTFAMAPPAFSWGHWAATTLRPAIVLIHLPLSAALVATYLFHAC